MHEMSLAESVRGIVEDTARSNGAQRVAAVRLEVGALAMVEIEALRFAFDVVKRGSLADDALLEIVEVEGSAWCMKCSKPVVIAMRGDACPHCESHQLQVTGGEQFRVLDIQIE